MISVLFVVGIIVLSFVFIFWTRRLALFALGLAGIAIGFGLIQRIASLFGFEWTLISMQVVLLSEFVALAAFAWSRKSSKRAPLRRQVLAVGLPIAVTVIALSALLLWAQSTYGSLAAFGFLMERSDGVVNALWLNTTSELAQGIPVTTWSLVTATGVLPLLVIATSLSATWSIITSGGVNEPVVAAQAVVTASFLLVAISPLVLAPIVCARFPMFRATSKEIRVPLPLLWVSSLILVFGSASLIAFSNVPAQLALLVVTLWIGTFLAASKIRMMSIAASIAFIGMAATFPPLIPLGVIVTLLVIAHQVRARKEQGSSRTLIVLAATIAAAWPLATLLGERPPTFPALAITVPLFALTAASVVAVGYLMQQRESEARQGFSSIAALIGLLIYASSFGVWAFAFEPEGFPNDTRAMFFLAAIAGLVSTLPIALSGLGERSSRSTVLQIVAVFIVLWVVATDTIITQVRTALNFESRVASAESGLSPLSALTSQAQRDPRAASMPIACLYLPPQAQAPSAYPDPEFSLACTRMLVSLGARQGKVGSLLDWLNSELVSNTPLWEGWYENLEGTPPDAAQSQVLLLDEQGAVIGFEQFGSLVDRYRPAPPTE